MQARAILPVNVLHALKMVTALRQKHLSLYLKHSLRSSNPPPRATDRHARSYSEAILLKVYCTEECWLPIITCNVNDDDDLRSLGEPRYYTLRLRGTLTCTSQTGLTAQPHMLSLQSFYSQATGGQELVGNARFNDRRSVVALSVRPQKREQRNLISNSVTISR